MKEITLHSAIAEMSPEDFAHPGLRKCTFIFCDDQPNENNQGIAYEDFAEIQKSAIGTPIKIRFIKQEGTTSLLGIPDHKHAEDDDNYQGAGGHMGSIPIGYIRNMFERKDGDINQLIAEAMLFADEYPEEVGYLDKAYAEGKAPGISWELKYSDSIIKDGIEWLKGLVTRAATFVRNPAYGTRTAILALASNQNINEEQMFLELSELVNDNSPKITVKGGNNRMDEKEIQKLQDELAAAKESLAEKEKEVETLTDKVNELTTANSEKAEKIAEYETKEKIASRTAALVEAGVTLPTEPEKLAAKQAFIAKMDDESFAEYKDDLATAIAASKKRDTKEGLASRRPLEIPRFGAEAEVGDGDEPVTLTGLKTRMGELARARTRVATSESE